MAVTRWSTAVAGLNAVALITAVTAAAAMQPSHPPAARATPRATTTEASSPAATPAPRAATPAPRQATPPVVLIAVRPVRRNIFDTLGAPHVLAINTTGQAVSRPRAQPVPFWQVSHPARVIVTSKELHSTSSTSTGCGIAGCSTTTYGTVEAGLAISHLDGSHERVITKGGYDVTPAFSPNGRRIVYSTLLRLPGGDAAALALISPDGSGRRLLIAKANDGYHFPTWSPSGTYVAAVRARSVHNIVTSRIVLIPTGGGPVRELAAGEWRDLSWSHDGRTLVAVKQRMRPQPGSFPFPSGDDLWAIPVNGGPPRQLTHIAPDLLPNVSSCDASGGTILTMGTPVWSPDDRSIAFLSSHRHVQEFNVVSDVFTVSATGGPPRLLRATPKSACTPNGGNSVGSRWLPHEQVALLGWI